MRSSCEGDAPVGWVRKGDCWETIEEGLTDDERKKFGN